MNADSLRTQRRLAWLAAFLVVCALAIALALPRVPVPVRVLAVLTDLFAAAIVLVARHQLRDLAREREEREKNPPS